LKYLFKGYKDFSASLFGDPAQKENEIEGNRRKTHDILRITYIKIKLLKNTFMLRDG